MKSKMRSLFFAPVAIGVVFMITFGCKSFTSSTPEVESTNLGKSVETANSESENNGERTETEDKNSTKVEKADFNMTAEEMDKEFTKEGVTDKELEKYASKNIAVTGRVTLLVLEKQGTTQPWVTLFAPGIGHGVSCYFDDDDVGQMKALKEDKMVTVQGFQNDFIVPEISPRLDHCVVLKAD